MQELSKDSGAPVVYFETSSSTEKLDAALAKAQAEIKVAVKNRVNPHFKSEYADLESCWDACRPALAKYGINVTQWPLHSTDGRQHLITRIAHSGEWMKVHSSIPVTKQDAQGYGSGISYLKRFTLSAALGIATGEGEDDGNAASEKTQKRTAAAKKEDAPMGASSQPPRSSAVGALTDKQISRAYAIAHNAGISEAAMKGWIHKNFGKESITQLDRNQYDHLCNEMLKTKAALASKLEQPPPDFAQVPPGDD